ncbi:uncharacterized protein TRIVIDRAFT_226121 [Trichoderma virens Gv29-8]|uniref:Fucose-specific lectin n=1 Tax=Hypocrea virens (strain Gv29-8 / FGSC 10586) TaxID=413071 RepID=G9N5F8_HYPVG|nr:uncharacterized protein TRIVIDRAFT_226121 [Trichoderma virens Gv29-8]EHK18003.1 hypothetical protein TRIVIDRAFT_226121 [Trichoderma virens Gv29-8]UKZ54136.1 hypothetical protein TrVGV298_007942 [Trichoderma virens]
MSTIFDRDTSGLEVRPPDVGGLEVRTPDIGGLEVSTKAQLAQGLEVFRGYDGLEVINNGADGNSGIKTEGLIEETERKPRKKKLWFILAGVALLLVIVGAVLGGVFGSRRNHKTPVETPGASATPEASATPPASSGPLNAIYAGSGIGVTGWWTGSSSFTIRLIYQGQDGNLRLMRYHSGDGKWSTLATLTDTKAKLGTPITASCFNIPFFFFTPVTSSNNFTQVEIFYLNDANEIQEFYFREQDSPSPSAQTFNGSGIMSSKGWKAAGDSKIATYWPSVIFQDGSGQMQEAYYANLTWAQTAVGLKCQNNSAFAEVPYSVIAGRFGGERLIYQRDDQKLLVEERNNSTNKLSIGAPSITIPANAAMGAFTVPRDANSADGAMNTYILWQDSTGALQMTWEDDDTGWRTSSTPTSLGSPDKGTGISCLTPTLWAVASLLSDYGMARCYYLVDGQIREVQYDGSNWSVIGNVQLD